MYRENRSGFDERVRRILEIVETTWKTSSSPIFKLMTVLIADLVGATAAKDEYGHSKGMKRCRMHNLIATEAVKAFNGKVVKYIGDAVLAVFPDRCDAVAASLHLRKALEEVKQEEEEFQVPLETRITLASGTVEELFTESGYDIGGKIVDITARLQEVASPGQILAEVGVIEHIGLILKQQIPSIKIPGIKDAGELQLKGLKHPIKALEITTQDRPFGNPPSERGRYISSLVDEISSCKSRVWLSVRVLKSRKQRKDIGLLQDNLVKAQNDRGVDVRIINNGSDAESLKTAAEIYERGLNVRFCEAQVDSSINLVDNNTVILSSKRKDRFFSKNKYWKMTSYHVNAALALDFQARWDKAISGQLQLAEILDRNFKNCNSVIDRDEITDHIHDRFGIEKGAFVDGCLQLLGFTRKARYIFILGRPGTGKSSIRKGLARKLENQAGARIKQVDDYDGLKEMFEADFNSERFIPQRGGGFMVKDPGVLTDVLRNISSECLTSGESHLTWLIEFARGQYAEAFAAFAPKVLEKAVVIHISCEKPEIYKRLKARAQSGGSSVSEEVIEQYYKDDDAPDVCKKMGIPCIEVDNNTPIDELNSKVDMINRWLEEIADMIYR